MDFFEALRHAADKRQKELYSPGPDAEFLGRRGMECIIEALREMMVGGPIRATSRHITVEHADGTVTESTNIIDPMGGHVINIWRDGHHGTDGEEVAVIVFRVKP